MSLKMKLLAYIKNSPHPVPGGEVDDYTKSLGYTASNGLRRCRELVNEGKLARYLRGGHVVYTIKTGELTPKILVEAQDLIEEVPFTEKGLKQGVKESK